MTLRYIESGNRHTVVQPGMEGAHRWPLFAALTGFFVAVLWAIGFWPLTLAGGALAAYLVGGVCFNRTIVEVDGDEIRWWRRPLPLGPRRRIPRSRAQAWLFGALPVQMEAWGSAVPDFRVAVECGGKTMVAIRHLSSREEARTCALYLAKATGLKAHGREALRDSEAQGRMALLLAGLLAALVLAIVLAGR